MVCGLFLEKKNYSYLSVDKNVVNTFDVKMRLCNRLEIFKHFFIIIITCHLHLMASALK